MWEPATEFVAIVGADMFVDTGPLITFNDSPLVIVTRRTSDGLMGVSLEVFTPDGQHAARVLNGKIKVVDRYLGPPHPVQIQVRGGIYRIVLRDTNTVLCEVRREPVAMVKGEMDEKASLMEKMLRRNEAFGRDDEPGLRSIAETMGAAAKRVGTMIRVSTNLLLPNGQIFRAAPTRSKLGRMEFVGNTYIGNGVPAIAINGRNGLLPFHTSNERLSPAEIELSARLLDREIRLAAADEWPAKETGENCDVEGNYRSSGCGHPTTLSAANGTAFPICPECGENNVWTLEVAEG